MNEICTNVKAKSFFSIIKKDKDGNETYRSDPTCNQMTDYAYSQIIGTGNTTNLPITGAGNQKASFRYLRFGTGTDEIVPSSLSLDNQTTAFDGSVNSPPTPTVEREVIGGISYFKAICTYILPLGIFNNETFTQVGLFSGTGATTLMCGQLIKDNLGNPTTVTFLQEDQPVIEYTIYFPEILIGDELGNFSFEYDEVSYEAELTCLNQNIVAVAPGQNIQRWPAFGTATRTVFSDRCEYVFDHTFTLLGTTTPISFINVVSAGSVIIARLTIDPPLPKTDQNEINISFRWTVRWR